MRKSHFFFKYQPSPSSAGLGGTSKTTQIALSEMIDRTHRPRIKLH
ncbi:NADH dehydrogenase [Polaromonas sp. CG9_12]|nr:NADH dehydrogenase [Polaromonas sp. CG9_12]